MYVNCEGIVLKKYRYSETSYILHLFTREFGRVNALAKGARRKNSSMLGHFDLYSVEEITLFRRMKSDLDLATGANLLLEGSSVRSSAEVFSCMGILSEIILKSCMLYDKHELAFTAVKEFLLRADEDRMKAVSDLVPALWLILHDLGFEPQTRRCVKCGTEEFSEGLIICPENGGIVCAGCAGKSRLQRLDAGDLAGIRHIAEDNSGIRVAFGSNRTLEALMDYCDYVLGMSCRAFRVLKKIRNKKNVLSKLC